MTRLEEFLNQNKNRQIWTISKDQSVIQALILMSEKNIGAIIIIDNNDFPIGIFSERDYARKVILKGKSSKDTLLDEVMTKNLITVTKDYRIDKCMEIMNQHGEVIGQRKYNISDQEIRNKIFRYSPFSHPLVMIRKSILDKVGSYDPAYAPADDYELYFRIGNESQFANLPDVIMRYRVIPSSITFMQTKKMELATINVRNQYSKNPNYNFTLVDKIYNAFQYLSIYIVPSRLKIYLFNLLRNN